MKNQNLKTGKRVKFILAFIVILICFIAYYQFLHSSQKLESNIFHRKIVIAAHHSEIWSTAFSPDGTLLASGSVDSTLKIWNAANGALVNTLKHPVGVTYLTWSPDGYFIATGAYDGKLRLWKLPEGILIKEFTVNDKTIWSVDFSADGKQLAGAGEDAVIKIWDIKSGKLVSTLNGHTKIIWDIKFSPNGATLASSSFDATVRIWDAASGKLLQNLREHSEAIVSLAFSHDGKMLVTTSDDKTIKFWYTADWTLIRSLTVPEHIQASAFSPDNKLLLTGGRDKPAIGEFLQNFLGESKYNKGVSMRLWDVGTGELLQTFSSHSNDVNDVSWSKDGKFIASGSSDKTIELWELQANK